MAKVEENLAQGKPVMVEVLESIIIAVALAVIIRVFILAPFFIPSGSMIPTLMEGDRIIASKITYRFTAPKRGDIIVFKYPVDNKTDYVKRLIGLGGETVELKNNRLYINGQMMPENYLPQGVRLDNFGPEKVPEGEYFMMGDNRTNSSDSRSWGTLPRKNIIGKALFTYWPLNRIHILR